MGKRGPKPVDSGLLLIWEFEFYKAFRLLRDGTQLPSDRYPKIGLTKSEAQKFLQVLKKMTPERFWRVSKRQESEMGFKVNLKKPSTQMDRWWAEQQLREEIRYLERALNPRPIHAMALRRAIWKNLVNAKSATAVKRACKKWKELPDVIGAGLTPFPEHVSNHADQFLKMKLNSRFPRSEYSDDARLLFLARGMAGAILGKSPLTAIEHLRNLKHNEKGPLWVESEKRCTCWRCLSEGPRWEEVTQGAYATTLRMFIEIANRQ
jgi:hypothetical protein